MLTEAAARSFSDDNAIRYVLPVLWMAPCFHLLGPAKATPTGHRRESVNNSVGCTEMATRRSMLEGPREDGFLGGDVPLLNS